VGIFQLSKVPNNIAIERQPLLQYSPIIEYEKRTSFFGGHPGSIKALVYYDDGFFGPYADAVDAARGTGHVPSTADVRSKHLKAGGGINIAQEVASHIGVFGRASAMNGTYEADEFTDIDSSLSGGISVDGGLYRRPNDALGSPSHLTQFLDRRSNTSVRADWACLSAMADCPMAANASKKCTISSGSQSWARSPRITSTSQIRRTIRCEALCQYSGSATI
jgi:Carbohydrate-selective porin, OprB family